ncbi:MAG TPA: hypothetical protein PLU07_06965 [Ferruginibacter sp.]|nr:hypothetical protein [Ferruginibacter sp.]
MKKLIVCCMIWCTSYAHAQTATEFTNLLKTLLPDEKNTARTLPWPTTNSIVFKNAAPVKRGNSYYRAGTASVFIDGKKLICMDEISEKKQNCNWQIELEGDQKGYHSFSLGIRNFPGFNPETLAQTLFPKNEKVLTGMKVCLDGFTFNVHMYTVMLPGKRKAWMLAEYENRSATGAQYKAAGFSHIVTLMFYTDEKAALKQCGL